MTLFVQAALLGCILGLAFCAGQETYRAIRRKITSRLQERMTIVIEVDSSQAVSAIDELTARLEGLSNAAKKSGLP